MTEVLTSVEFELPKAPIAIPRQVGSLAVKEAQTPGAETNELDDLDELAQDRDLVRTYLNAIGGFKILKAEQEVELAKRIEAGLFADYLLHQPDIIDEQYQGDLNTVMREGDLAKELLINSNLKLVVSIAKRYLRRTKHMDFLDLIQEGNIGLVHAVEKFDYKKGYKFSTYATWWIKQAIGRALAEKDPSRKLTNELHDEISAFKNRIRDLESDLGHSPSSSEIKEALGLTDQELADLRRLERYYQADISLDMPVGEDREEVLSNFLPGHEDTELSALMDSDEGFFEIMSLIELLPEPERTAFRALHGIDVPFYKDKSVAAKKIGLSLPALKRRAARASECLQLVMTKDITIPQALQLVDDEAKANRAKRQEQVSPANLLDKLGPDISAKIIESCQGDPERIRSVLNAGIETLNFSRGLLIGHNYSLGTAAIPDDILVLTKDTKHRLETSGIDRLKNNLPAMLEGRWSDLNLGTGLDRSWTPLALLVAINYKPNIFEPPETRCLRALAMVGGSSLSDKHKRMVAMLYGLEGAPSRGVSETSRRLGISSTLPNKVLGGILQTLSEQQK